MGVPEIFSVLLETRVLVTPCTNLTKSRDLLLFRRHREIAKRDNKLRRVCLSVCPPVLIEQLGSHWEDFL